MYLRWLFLNFYDLLVLSFEIKNNMSAWASFTLGTIGVMKDLLVWVLCVALVLVGVVLGHSYAMSDAEFLDSIIGFLLSIKEVFIGAALALFVSHFYYKKSGDDLKVTAEKLESATNRILRYQNQRDKGVDVDVVQDGKEIIISQRHTVTEELAATGGVDRIVMTRTVKKADP